MGKNNPLQMGVNKVQEGVALCNSNARRFITSSRTLLENNGDIGIAFILWSYAVEELGKGIMLAEQIGGIPLRKRVTVELDSRKHVPKFTKGLESLDVEQALLKRSLKVTYNNLEESIQMQSSFLNWKSDLCIGSRQTG